MANTSSYSANNVSATLDGQRIIGLWEGDDALEVKKMSDVGGLTVGADGTGIFSQSASNAAEVTLRLQHTSATHRLLHQKWARQRAPGIRVSGFSFSFHDNDSGEGGAADECFIKSAPVDKKGEKASVREWVLVTAMYLPSIPNA